MVLMNAGKKARNAASIYNSTKIFGDMGGLAPSVGLDASVKASYNRANTVMLNLSMAQLKSKGLLSKNPAGSGGVGKKVLMYYSR